MYISEPPTKVQNLMCLTPTDTNWVSESGLNSTTKIRSVWPPLLLALVPDRGVRGHASVLPITNHLHGASPQLTFLPPPHCNGVLWLHPHGKQQLPGGAEVHVANTFSVRTAQDGQRLLGHGIPNMDGRSQTFEKRPTDTTKRRTSGLK